MNGYLLDSHVILWWLADKGRLSEEAVKVIEDPLNRLWFSAAGVWELAIKRALGRIDMPDNLLQVLDEEKIGILDIRGVHALGVASLQLIHSDPFDRMMIAQALHEDLVLITRDTTLPKYRVPVLSA